MSQEEWSYARDGIYSAWHRRLSTKRFVGLNYAQLLAQIDVDAIPFLEYDDGTKEPLAIIETARDIGQSWKPATVIRGLAKRCTPVLPAFVVLYAVSPEKNPACPQCLDISSFRVREVWPIDRCVWTPMTPKEYATFLLNLRQVSAQRLDSPL